MNRAACKARSYFAICLAAMASTCVFLSTFDRCLSTSRNVNWRRLSSISFARRISVLTMLFLLISSGVCLIAYDVFDGICTTMSGFATIAVVSYALLFVSFIPHGGMLICGVMTWIHTRRWRNRVDIGIGVIRQTHATHRMNRQLLILIFVHASMSIILEVQRDIVATYNLITNSAEKSVEQKQIENFITQIGLLLYYAKYGMVFYFNYACSSLFRKTFRQSAKSVINKCLHLRCVRS
ncbi:unnamed protein product [Adineta ricciae]|uniref:Uncharacterized protein n=1 Tax=Adineta ricciae TaxID=249248 RepID=A0A814EIJ9_ADIRI|nr:unnamed protein product [Adineta ricciae]CAF1278945.1 unnamed protein product [Adineta ricciae]